LASIAAFSYIPHMPRSRRWEFPGEFHHVMAGGLEGRDISGGGDNTGKAAFLTLLERRKRATIEMVVDRVGEPFGLPGESIVKHGRSSGKTVVGARSFFCYWAYREPGMSMVAIGKLFGITNGAISRLVRRGEEPAGAEGLLLEL
jgi:hypothetical protein